MAKLEVLHVEWEDSSYRNGWREGMPSEGTRISSVGIKVRSDKSGIVLATSSAGDDEYLQQVSIPRAAVRKVRRVKL